MALYNCQNVMLLITWQIRNLSFQFHLCCYLTALYNASSSSSFFPDSASMFILISVFVSLYWSKVSYVILELIFSMGGSVAVHVAARKAIHNLHGLLVVDVVEVSSSFSLCWSLLYGCTRTNNLVRCWFWTSLFLNREQQWLHWFICRRS